MEEYLREQEKIDATKEAILSLEALAHGQKLDYGLPYGMISTPITSGIEQIQYLADTIYEKFGEPKQETFDPLTIPPDLPGCWEFYRKWRISHSWKFQTGMIVIWRDVSDPTNIRYRKVFHSDVRNQQKLSPSDCKRLELLLKTFSCLSVFQLAEAEQNARATLIKLLSPLQVQSLLITDAIKEIGKSGVIYLIRKNRPTLAFRQHPTEHYSRSLGALCLHPLAYYDQSWAGTLPPSDEMIAHLVMIRSDEHFYWRKANVHLLSAAEAGIG